MFIVQIAAVTINRSLPEMRCPPESLELLFYKWPTDFQTVIESTHDLCENPEKIPNILDHIAISIVIINDVTSETVNITR